MFTNDCLNVNEKGHLTIGGCDTVELAKEYGTPLYVLDENVIRNTCKSYVSSFEKFYNGNGRPLYASKALSCLELCRIANDEGLGLDVVSGGELYTALKSGFPAEKIHFHGNNKTNEEIKMALENNVGKIVVDNLEELERLNSIAEKMDKVANISFRIKPGVDAHTHNFIRTGQIDSKFGFALETGEAYEAVKKAISYENVCLKELHCHIGSQIFDIEPFVTAAEIMMDFIGKIKNELNVVISELNLGGGFGIMYVNTDTPVPYENYMEKVSKAVKAKAEEYGIPVPYIYIEPGRSIVGEAGITLYTVGAVKTIPNVRTYVSVDGGMT
ncbi:MAG: diaminopimelate decarboxylase, partial [Oscillospiraceae bacterium]|nr:diaminopimelate decarboxylase [Oscillospiraceae bacterium]